MLDKVSIIGYSGHAYVVADAAIAMGMQLTHYCDIDIAAFNPFQLEYLGFEGDEDFEGWLGDTQFILGIGDNQIRRLPVVDRDKKLVGILSLSDLSRAHLNPQQLERTMSKLSKD